MAVCLCVFINLTLQLNRIWGCVVENYILCIQYEYIVYLTDLNKMYFVCVPELSASHHQHLPFDGAMGLHTLCLPFGP